LAATLSTTPKFAIPLGFFVSAEGGLGFLSTARTGAWLIKMLRCSVEAGAAGSTDFACTIVEINCVVVDPVLLVLLKSNRVSSSPILSYWNSWATTFTIRSDTGRICSA
jgi:hypothetical protein